MAKKNDPLQTGGKRRLLRIHCKSVAQLVQIAGLLNEEKFILQFELDVTPTLLEEIREFDRQHPYND